MTDPLGKFWAWVGAGTMAAFGLYTAALVLKDQQGAVNIINASASGVGTVTKALGSLG